MIDFYIRQIKNEYEKFRPYSWHVLYCKKNNAVQEFRLSVNSVSCSFRGNKKRKTNVWIFSRMQCLEVFRQRPHLQGSHLEEDLVLCMHIVEAPPHCLLYFGYEWSAGELVFHSWFACPLSLDPLYSSLRGLGTVLMAILWRGTSCFIVRVCQGVVHRVIVC